MDWEETVTKIRCNGWSWKCVETAKSARKHSFDSLYFIPFQLDSILELAQCFCSFITFPKQTINECFVDWSGQVQRAFDSNSRSPNAVCFVLFVQFRLKKWKTGKVDFFGLIGILRRRFLLRAHLFIFVVLLSQRALTQFTPLWSIYS